MRSSEKVKGSLYSPLLINDLATKRFCNRQLHDGILNISLELKQVQKNKMVRWRFSIGFIQSIQDVMVMV